MQEDQRLILDRDGIYTICAFNPHGRIYRMHIRRPKVVEELYLTEARGRPAHRIIFNIRQAKRWSRVVTSVVWWPKRPMVIWPGMQEPNIAMTVRRGCDDRFGLAEISYYWGSFDPRYLVRAVDSVMEKAVWSYIPPARVQQPEFQYSE